LLTSFKGESIKSSSLNVIKSDFKALDLDDFKTDPREGSMSHGRVLIVEDQPEVRHCLSLILTRKGYDVVTAEDGASGIEAIRSGDNPLMVDAIICDLLMPKVNGAETIRYFRSQFPSVPVIVLTGHPEVERANWFYEQGVLHYLLKPISAEVLLEATQRAVESHELFKDQFVA
jgi:two-component system chemotaxis response regulator CheY